MVAEKKLYRSRDTLLGGVCTGIAEYFNIDPIVVQIITVILTIATAGLVAVAYIALWIIIPASPDPAAPVDVEPHEVHSDTYGQVNYEGKQEDGGTSQSENPPNSVPFEGYTGNAHVPPEPPSARAQEQAHQAVPPYTSAPPPNPQPQGAASPNPPTTAPAPQSGGASSGSAGGALWFGFILLFIGVCALLGTFVTGVEWWQFWPLLFVISGIGHMVVPGKKGHRMSRFMNGLLQFVFGAAALPFSLGILSPDSIYSIFINLWPILLIMCGLLVLGGAMNAPIITLLAGVCFIAFCVIGIVWFSYPGPTDLITLALPTGQVYTYAINPWSV